MSCGVLCKSALLSPPLKQKHMKTQKQEHEACKYESKGEKTQ